MRARLALLILFLLVTISACNLGNNDTNDTTSPNGNPTSGPIVAGKPVVTIISPQSGDEVVVGDTVLVSVNATDQAGVTRIQLLANNQIVKTISSDSITGDTNKNALLDYTPRAVGDVTLSVVAYRGTTASDPATVQVKVRSSVSQVTATVDTSLSNIPDIDPNDPTCRVLVNSGLNFRTGPGTNYDVITLLSYGTVVPVIGRLGDNSWWQLRTSDLKVGWVFSQYTTLYGSDANCNAVPVVAPPASPTPKGFVPTATPTITPQPTNTSQPSVPTATPTKPDLVVTTINGPTTISLGSGATQKYAITIQNTGGSSTGQFTSTIVILPGGTPQDLGTTGGLDGGQSIVLTVDLTFTATGDFTIQVNADSSNQVSEISEANNLGQIAIKVNS